MPIVRMPDGTNVSFPDAMPSDQISALIAEKFPQETSQVQQVQTPSLLERAFAPITSYLPTQQRMARESAAQAEQGINQLRAAQTRSDVLQGGLNTAVGGLGWLASPLNAAARTFVGQPVQEATGIPRELTEFTALLALPIPGIGMTRLPRSTLPMMPGQSSTQAAQELGLTGYPRIAATESSPTKRIGLSLAKVPWAGSPIQAAIERSSQELGQRTARIAGDFIGGGTTAERAGAGSSARQSIEKYIGPSSLSPDNLASRSGKLYDKVDQLVNNNVITPLDKTLESVLQIHRQRNEAFLPTGGAIERVINAVTSDGLSYQGIKKLRTSIGEDMKRGLLPEGMSNDELKIIYGALSDDLATSVRSSGGPAAQAAFDRANRYHRLISERREELLKVAGVKSDEALYDTIVRYASATGGANINMLSKIIKAVSSGDWAEIASTAVSRLGQLSKGNIETFSPQRFLSEYRNLTPTGKAMLFGSVGKPELRRALDNVEKVSNQLADLGAYANPAGTAQQGIGTAFGVLGFAGFAEGWVRGDIPWGTLTGLIGIRGVAKLLSRPVPANATARWLNGIRLVIKTPSASSKARLLAASTNLATNLRDLGFPVSAQQLMQPPRDESSK